MKCLEGNGETNNIETQITGGIIKDTVQHNHDSDDSEDIPAYLGMMIQAGLTRW